MARLLGAVEKLICQSRQRHSSIMMVSAPVNSQRPFESISLVSQASVNSTARVCVPAWRAVGHHDITSDSGRWSRPSIRREVDGFRVNDQP